MQSTARKAESGVLAWCAWYRARFLRLYPMYWVAHVVYLVSPFVARLEPVDSRIVLSLLGLRFINISMNFMYLNAAWWYFSMLIQLYFIFPLLFRAAERLGPWTFLLIACATGFLARYLLLVVFQQSGLWVLGGFAICRLPEFALGMALAMWHRRSPVQVESFLLRGAGLATGLILYPAALWLYHNLYTYIFVDLATGGCCFLVILGIAGIISRFKSPAKVFGLVGAFSVRSLSDPPTLHHLAGTSHPRSTDLGIPLDRGRSPGRAQRLGNHFGKGNQHAGQQPRPGKETGARLISRETQSAPIGLAETFDSNRRGDRGRGRGRHRDRDDASYGVRENVHHSRNPGARNSREPNGDDASGRAPTPIAIHSPSNWSLDNTAGRRR